jgi:hypothetical protein
MRPQSSQEYQKEKHLGTVEKLYIYIVTKFGILLDRHTATLNPVCDVIT